MAPPTELLPFTIRVVTTDADLARVAAFRAAAYARHVPALAAQLARLEPADLDGSAVVLLAEAKQDGAPVGTMRIQTNRARALALERSVELPAPYRGATLAEATRLGVIKDPLGPVVKTFLFKAIYLYCLAHEIEWIVIAARSPLDRLYDALAFTDVFPGRGFIAMAHAGDLPHRVFARRVEPAASAASEHPMFGTIFLTHHPDISLANP